MRVSTSHARAGKRASGPERRPLPTTRDDSREAAGDLPAGRQTCREVFAPSRRDSDMGDFEGPDLQSVEEELDDGSDGDGTGRVVLGVLDGTTDPEEWVDAVDAGAVLVLNVEGGYVVRDPDGHRVTLR